MSELPQHEIQISLVFSVRNQNYAIIRHHFSPLNIKYHIRKNAGTNVRRLQILNMHSAFSTPISVRPSFKAVAYSVAVYDRLYVNHVKPSVAELMTVVMLPDVRLDITPRHFVKPGIRANQL